MNKKKVAILQSNYIPWKGVFDMINMVDVFVFFEDVDYTSRDWRNRNKIKTPSGELWLTVPVKKVPRGTKIKDIEIVQTEDWQRKHYLSFVGNYSRAPFFDKYRYLIEDFYLNHRWCSLSEMNIYMTQTISFVLGLSTKFMNSKDLGTKGTKDDKLIEICKKIDATDYLSGPAAKNYINNQKFIDSHVGLSYMKYDGYPRYEQLYGDYNPFVSVLDVIFNCGEKAKEYVCASREEIVFEGSDL